MAVPPIKKTGYKYQSYLCTLAYRKRGACCSKGHIPKPAFEAAVINTLVDEIFKMENVEEMRRLLAEQDAGRAAEINDQRREILARVTSNKKMLTNIADAIMENGSSPTLQSRLKTLEHEKLELEMQLNELDNAIPTPIPALSPALLERRLKRITTILKGKDEAAKKSLLRGLIAYVEVEREDKFLKGTIYVYPPEADDDNT